MLFEDRGGHGKDKKVIIVMLEGGIGDHLLATPLIRGMRKKYPADEWIFILMAMYHEAFGYEDINNKGGDNLICLNPHIDKLYSMRLQSGFYMDWARTADKIFRINPYVLSPQRLGSKHFAEIWCELHDIEMDRLVLDYFLATHEELQAKELIKTFDKPTVVIQPYGATDPIDHNKSTENKDWFDDRWQFLIHWLVDRGYDIIQIGKIGEHVFDNVFSMVGHTNLREAAVVVKYAEFFISIDSFLMHVAKAFDKIGVVLWGRSNPFRVGYIENYNVFKLHSCPEIFCGRPEGILFDVADSQPYFTPWNCPHRDCMNAITIADVCRGVGVIERNLKLDPVTFERQDLTRLTASSSSSSSSSSSTKPE